MGAERFTLYQQAAKSCLGLPEDEEVSSTRRKYTPRDANARGGKKSSRGGSTGRRQNYWPSQSKNPSAHQIRFTHSSTQQMNTRGGHTYSPRFPSLQVSSPNSQWAALMNQLPAVPYRFNTPMVMQGSRYQQVMGNQLEHQFHSLHQPHHPRQQFSSPPI